VAAAAAEDELLRAHGAFARRLFDACGSAGGALCCYSINELATISASGSFPEALEGLLLEAGLTPPPPLT
jgi:hypothetical protein